MNNLELNELLNYYNDYINKILKFNDDDNNNIKELEKLIITIENNNNKYKKEILNLLIKNNETIFTILTDLINNNINIIKNNKIEKLTKNITLINIIKLFYQEYYIDLNEFIEDNNLEENNKYIEDTYKQYLNSISKPLLTKEEITKLFIEMNNGNKNARNILIERNLKLVVGVARKYKYCNMSILDLIQEGNIGLIKAIDKFDITKGTTLSTYAIYWIKCSIDQAINYQSREIRLPKDICENLKTIERSKYYLSEKLNREPTLEEISEYTKFSIEKINKTISAEKKTISYNIPLDNTNETIIDTFPSQDDIEHEILFTLMLKQAVNDLLSSSLNERKQVVLKLRYGFDNKEPLLLKEVAKKLNMSVEGIRKTELQAIKELILLEKTKELAIYLDYPKKALQSLEEQKNKYKIKQKKK